MRPLELTVTGLRSYRMSTTVTFPDDWRLAAVVGPTGAGKSSLLEAIVYALFGSGTAPGASQPTNLITDDLREMRVVFGFGVGPERFEIARTYRRAGNVQPVLKSDVHIYNGAKDVDDAVARLLGLRQEAFCSTVLLPQGQFAKLLQAGSGVQKETLDAFFRLSEVTELSGRLVAAAATLSSRRKEVETVRDQLPPDPAAEIRQAARRLREAEQRRDVADKLAELGALHERSASTAGVRSETARRRAADLAKAADALDEVAARARHLSILAIEITSAEKALSERTDLASAAVSAARETLSTLDAPGVETIAARVETLRERIREASTSKGQASAAAAAAAQADDELGLIRVEHDGLADQRDRAGAAYEELLSSKAEARECLDRLGSLLDAATRSAVAAETAETRLADAARDLEQAEAAERQVRQQLTEAVEKLSTAEGAATLTRGLLAEAENTAAAATQRAEHLGRLRREREERLAARDRLVGELATSGAGLHRARTVAGHAARAESEADVRWREAQAAFQEARRGDAAAAAAVGCSPGDPCPVCVRELPPDFVPPAPSTGTRDAELAEQAAHTELASCRRATAREEAELAARAREEAGVATQLDAAEATLAGAESLECVRSVAPGAAATLLGAPAPGVRGLHRARGRRRAAGPGGHHNTASPPAKVHANLAAFG